MDRAQCLADIVEDLGALRSAYAKVGLLEADAPTGRLAEQLLGAGDESKRFRRDFLVLDAVVRQRVAWLVVDGGALRHIVTFGGNNVGKSTIVNVLAAAAVAVVSPEGGHTRRPQGYVASGLPLFGRNSYAFRDFQEVAPDTAPSGDFDRYARAPLASAGWPDDVAIWDTPDCDAVGSPRYLAGFVEAVTAADLVIYVTSLERYAVEHLVEWVFVLHDAGLPMLECLNKTRERDRKAVIDGQTQRIFPLVAERLALTAPNLPIVALRYLAEGEDSDLWGPAHPEAAQLREAALAAVATADRAVAGRAALDFAVRRIGRLLEPAWLESQARQGWSAAVASAVGTFVASYEQSYLTSSSVIEPFSRLNLAILELLDPNIPGLKETMAAIRSYTRWPARLILRIGRSAVTALFRDGNAAAGDTVAPELKAYSDAHIGVLATLGRRIDAERAELRHHPFWDNLDEVWQAELATLSDAFAVAVEEHMKQTDAEIKQAAADIYATLKERPATLNLLRGARVAANVGGALGGPLVSIFLFHGGVIMDLLEEAVVAPAMMSATEAATSALTENFLARRKAHIVNRLRAEARHIAETLYQAPLKVIADAAMARAGLLGVAPELLHRLPNNLLRLQQEIAEDRHGEP